MSDLTVLFLTVNRVPKDWVKYHRQVLLNAIEDHELITISREEMDMPGIQLRQSEEQSHSNIYRQMLRGAKLAKTPYIAIAEDDTLYTNDHFNCYRPPLDTFAYNLNRWVALTWGEPMFSFKIRISNCCCILPREEMIDALEERFAKWPDGVPHNRNGELGFAKAEKNMKVKARKMKFFYSVDPVVQFFHIFGTPGPYAPERILKRTHGFIRAYDTPYWGKAKELIAKFK
jgi:hypothetical protein